ncbi:hypothetical protein HUN08_06925 [Gordonia sp. X0973]|uniref:hypothetical protein n=1 Tax=Gordonia sp. X0973 TaxID=2742602 RepID=UPI000F5371BB|nr:hypothetical protein [Gordonia sp. X0973]QKT06951.1 hypothetical protein HUN08_06925 [Gordonia sp. X0973]
MVEYPFLVVGDFEAQVATDASLFVGRADENEPLVEVLGELDDDGETIVVFHAMYLTTGTVRTAGIGSFVGPGDLAGKQRK